jgi:hypothetical protein
MVMKTFTTTEEDEPIMYEEVIPEVFMSIEYFSGYKFFAEIVENKISLYLVQRAKDLNEDTLRLIGHNLGIKHSKVTTLEVAQAGIRTLVWESTCKEDKFISVIDAFIQASYIKDNLKEYLHKG